MENSEILQTILAGSLLFIVLSVILIKTVTQYKTKQANFLLEKRQMEIEFQKELLHTQLEIQEQTLKNISQEIHDNIGQALSLAKLNLNTMPATTDELLKQKISTSKELVSKAIVDLGILAAALIPIMWLIWACNGPLNMNWSL